MPSVYRFKVVLGNFGDGSPGVSILHTTVGLQDVPGDMQSFASLIHDAYTVAAPHLVSGMTISVDPEVTKHDVPTGKLQNVFVITPPATVLGASAGGNTSRATMAVCRHNTDAITAEGRRLLGRTYVGPIGATAIDNNGHITTAASAIFTGMWDGMQDIAGDLRLVVLHRYRKASEAGEDPKPESIGSFGHVVTTNCLALPGVLRSRRD